MSDALTFVFNCVSRSVGWLSEWNFLGVPFLVYIIGLAIVGLLIDFIFG